MTKRNPIMTLARDQQGQISIFFSASLIVLISIIAFVINVGLFVKAKINLQNATDAAAFSGAAVQARQLTKIAHLNWEMRNIFKEWMYKYYVVGNLNVPGVKNPRGSTVDFRLEEDVEVLSGNRAKDPYGFPAVCIHIAGNETNVCQRYAIPGLPEFGSYKMPGAEEQSRSFIDGLIGAKLKDCNARTQLNMFATTTWAYNVITSSADESLAGRGPAILSNRQGAWPAAIELAIRMRNLEYAMNRPPETEGVCNTTSNAGLTKCKKNISDLMNEKALGNERIVKAFFSGYRNLGNDVDDEMKETFTLKEIAPKPMNQPANAQYSASYLLVPQNKLYEKRYVDLKLMTVNYATFYAAMIGRASAGTVSAACDISKVAIPVPGYPLGFYKNPDLLTYYAVKGEAEFFGMFNPFNSEAIKLTAYAAAKPFGGRVGPMLFHQPPDSSFFKGRPDSLAKKSVPYLATIQLAGAPKKVGSRLEGTIEEGEYSPGVPLPINFTSSPGYFWLQDSDSPLGGVVTTPEGVQFGIPNLVYEFDTPDLTASNYNASGEGNIYTIKPSVDPSTDKKVGLFSTSQFTMFKGEIGGDVSPEMLQNQIARVRAPTMYEAANYLVPTPNDFNRSQDVDSFGFISGPAESISLPKSNGLKKYRAQVYAPLYRTGDQTDILYSTSSEVLSSIIQFMKVQETGIKKYRAAMNQAAKTIFDMQKNLTGAQAGSAGAYANAARGVSDIDFSAGDIPNQKNKSCNSMTGQFLYFYYGGAGLPVDDFVDAAGIDQSCPKPLGDLLAEYFAPGNSNNIQPSHYQMEYTFSEQNFRPSPHSNKGWSAFSAYMPGPFNGVSDDALYSSPFPNGTSERMRRNFYSTKFIALNALRAAQGYAEASSGFPIFSEGAVNTGSVNETSQKNFVNELEPASVDADLNSINH